MRYPIALIFAGSLGCAAENPPPKTGADASAEPQPRPSPAQAGPSRAPTDPLRRWSFDAGPAGSIPAGFRVLETASKGTLATWGVVDDASAPSGGKAFGVVETKNSGQTYNLALAPNFEATDVELTVSVKATTGKQDQGGGLAFRANGARDYYIARWNPLEKNVKFYVVTAQQRTALVAADIDLDPAVWHTMRVIVEGTRMELFMDETSVLVAEDDTLGGPGSVGLWTKADAATWFDDLTAQTL
ncbi:MAG: hypothetical protein ACE37F_10670 [Nannocystaceae bacterium]|nr:hypothetical protein [bacterium]